MDFENPEIPTSSQKSIEKNLFNFSLNFTVNNNINFSLSEIENNKLKLIAIEKNDKFNKYETILELEKLKNINKYFTKFNNYEDFKKDFIKLCNSKNDITIKYYNFDKIEINIKLLSDSDNICTFILNKVDMTHHKEQIKFQTEINEIINNLILKNKEMENNLKLKENDINLLKNENFKKTKEIKQIKQELLQLRNSFSLLAEYLNNSEKEKRKIKEKEEKKEIKEIKEIKEKKEIKERKEREERKKKEEIEKQSKAQKIFEKLDDEFNISSLETEEEVKKKIIELNFDNKKIMDWVESIM